ncbi:ABA4-like family protein [Kaistella antarctica]|uniref:DUF4281 domain-containing protein n=1 Tax=Kaistella antarctica TaxID=266748 RepID=A0A3S4VD82_9FLAO|nr:ABA4-like family protein [Kaistella antarctica]KEY19408.1 hypothetical protein HY04_13500 [Kaistella antarctica]SEW06646.1 protein of unknown function [Kaistella antarctica]VEH97538.1 Uncharacterised protein [Kaistella antarctica]
MKPEILFQILNNLVLLVWILMIVAPKWKVTRKITATFALTIILSIVYGAIIITSFGKVDFMDFGSLDGIVKMLQNSDAWGSSAIWYHFLAFDLFVGSWILKDAQKLGIPHLTIIPCLLFTFMLGPLGFLIYQIVKFGYLRFKKGRLNADLF